MAYYSVDDSGYAGNNRIYVKCTYDDGAVLDSTEAQETIDSAYIIYTNSYNTNWTDEFVLVKSIHPTNAVTLNTYGLVVKKDDESNVTTEEVIANMTISREWATN